MANSEISPSEVKRLTETTGKVRGAVFQTDAEYVKEKKGKAGLILLERELKKINCPINYESIKATAWYPLGLRIISLLMIKKAFNWTDKEIEKMGNAAPAYSFIVRMLMKYFLSPQRTFKESSKYWEKHYTIGSLEAYKYSKEKEEYILRLKDFKVHPILCPYLTGYFFRMGQYVLPKGGKISITESKCVFKGDPFHEFIMRWR